jgi:DNA-binding SARP family transcriptional activator
MAAATSHTTPRLELTSAPAAVLDGQRFELAPPDALLLAYLALEGATARDRLAALLWPASTEPAARNALRQRLFRLRKQLGAQLVQGSAQLALARGVAHDLAPGSGLLGELRATGCEELDAWLLARREAARGSQRQQLQARIEALEAEGDAAAALPLAEQLLAIEPLSEDAHRRVMRLNYLAGDRAAAMLAFDRCERILKDEVGTRPGAETLALLQTIEAGMPEARPAAAPGWSAPLPASVLRPPRMVGRERELAALQSGWRAGTLVLVTGEAGIGKSRLLHSLGGAADGIASASARPGDNLVPYASFARLLHQVRVLAPDLFAAWPQAALQRLAPLLPGLVSERRQNPRRATLTEPAAELMQQAAAQVEGFVLDDLHFADDASLDLLQALLGAPRSGRPQRWALGLRPPAADSRLSALTQALARAAPALTVDVQPLDVAQLAEFVDSLALPGVNGAPIAVALRARSGGNPLFALETLKLAWGHGRFDLEGDLPRPPSLGQLIGEQLARLSTPALALARLAAVAAADFSLPLAEQVLGRSALELADAWHELESQRVLAGAEFAHDLVYEAVLAGVPAVIARTLHARVAGWLQAHAGEPAHIAAHWEAAGEPPLALPHWRDAAERAHQALREREHIRLLLRAADIAEATGQPDAAFECVVHAVEAHMNSIREDSGFVLLDRLDRLAATEAQRALALGHRAWYLAQLPDHERAAALGQQALALAEPLREPALAGLIRQRLGTSLAMLGRFEEALAHLQTAQAVAGKHLQPDDRAELHGNLAVVLDNMGRPVDASAHHKRAAELSQSLGDHIQSVTHLNNHAVSRLTAGDASAAQDLAQQAQQLATTYEMQGASVAFVWLVQAQASRALGLYRDALADFEQALALVEASNPARRPAVWVQRALCWLDLGQWARAGQDLKLAGDDGTMPPHLQARRLLLQARLQRALGQDARATLAQAAAIAPSGGWPEVRLAILSECALDLGAGEAVASLLRVAQEARRTGLEGSALAAELLAAPLLAPTDAARAQALARQALAAGARTVPALRCRAETWYHAWRTFRACGDAEAAREAAAAGRRWLLATAGEHVGEAFRESFLHRVTAHQALLGSAA